MMPARSVSGDRYIICPYDDTHEILAKSFSAHLIKCRRNHAGSKLMTCPLDSTHKIPKPEMTYHMTVCDKKCLLDREVQKRAGDSGLRGDVIGPPILASHTDEMPGEECWDDIPEGSFITPALFNDKPRKTQESYHQPPGGYVPPQKDEQTIRKVPNAPAKAATLSNPASQQMRAPGPNQIFNYSLGLTDAGRGSGLMRMPINRPSSNPSLRPALGSAGAAMSGVRLPSQDQQGQGPRFIGRGLSKYATKSLPTQSALNSQTSETTNHNEQKKPSPSNSEQFADMTTTTTNADKESQILRNNPVPTQQQQNFQIPTQYQGGYNQTTPLSLSEQEMALKKQQQILENSILLSQQEQMKQLKEQHVQQGLELEKKHQLQLLQLRTLQAEEKQKLVLNQNRVEQDLRTNQSLMNNSLAATGLPDHQSSFLPSAMLEAMRMVDNGGDGGGGRGGGEGFAGLLALGTGMQSVNTGSVNSMEPVNASMSRVSLQDSNNTDGAGNIPEAEADIANTRRKLEEILRAIEILEQKSCLGHRLSVEEENKLRLKDDILSKLEQLRKKS